MHVRDMMTRHVISVSPDESLDHARALFRANNIPHLIVMENDAVAGIVTPALKVRASGGFNYPGTHSFSISGVYLFGAQ